MSWRAAMASALYGPDGFFVRAPDGPAGHFRTSVHASPLFAGALLRLIERVDAALGRPDPFDVVDVGAGRGELLTTLCRLVVADKATPRSRVRRRPLGERIRFTAVEVAPRPRGLDEGIRWRRAVPDGIVGVLVATEWLDNVPLDAAEVDRDGWFRRVLVDPATGVETLGGVVHAADAFWLARWWPGRAEPGERAEIGWPRDVAWADAVSSVRRGCALAVDYGHVRDRRPALGTLTGYRGGRQVAPVPDGTCDVTAHVAMDAVAEAAGTPYALVTQRDALRALGVDGARPPLDRARTDPAGYVRALAGAGAAAELTDPAGLGGHWWLLHTIGIPGAESLLA
ncbi:MAG TPA: SAM-dependent methyltransferase [Actinoplanes sp.]|nr:SAM-dependent methyltransferase [Actinoplanes sp.]